MFKKLHFTYSLRVDQALNVWPTPSDPVRVFAKCTVNFEMIPMGEGPGTEMGIHPGG
jgi:hypothetical protein